jgi:hypothetical protein
VNPDRILLKLLFLLIVPVAGVSAAMPEPVPLSRVIELSRAGADASAVGAELKRRRTTYALRGSDFGKLADAGVAAPVLDQMQQAFVSDVDRLVRMWSEGASYGRCERCYPWEVDLASLPDLAGIRQTTPSLRVGFGRPLGLPGWYRPIRASSRFLNVEDLQQMLQAGNPADSVAGTLREARLKDVIGVAGLTSLGAGLQAGLSGSRYAQLRQSGMPDVVLDEIQSRYIAEVVEHLRFRYMGIGRSRH